MVVMNFPFLRDDDDINDVASMAGVNLSEESARILATNSELVGTLTRSCKDETFLFSAPLQRRILEIGMLMCLLNLQKHFASVEFNERRFPYKLS